MGYFTPFYKFVIMGKTTSMCKGGERMVEGMTLDELKQVTIDYYVNLQRIKKADTGNNPELEYQLKVVKNKLASLGIPSEEFEM